jgi:hypothetical protein
VGLPLGSFDVLMKEKTEEETNDISQWRVNKTTTNMNTLEMSKDLNNQHEVID